MREPNLKKEPHQAIGQKNETFLIFLPPPHFLLVCVGISRFVESTSKTPTRHRTNRSVDKYFMRWWNKTKANMATCISVSLHCVESTVSGVLGAARCVWRCVGCARRSRWVQKSAAIPRTAPWLLSAISPPKIELQNQPSSQSGRQDTTQNAVMRRRPSPPFYVAPPSLPHTLPFSVLCHHHHGGWWWWHGNITPQSSGGMVW